MNDTLKIVSVPLTDEAMLSLRAGEMVYLSGEIYTGRDAAHKRLYEMIQKGETLPFELNGKVIYYAGPCPAKPGQAIGSVGPTTSGRMDAYSPLLISHGLKAMIGKGYRSPEVKQAIIDHGGVYFAAIGGAAALMAKCVKLSEVIAFDDLGTEAVRRLVIEKLPVIVAIDSKGSDFYSDGTEQYRCM